MDNIAPSFLLDLLFIRAGNEEMYKRLDKLEFPPDQTTVYGVS